MEQYSWTKVDAIQDSIRELYSRLSGATVRSYGATLAPLPPHGRDAIIGAQHLAKTLARHLRMTDVRLIVQFSALEHFPGATHAGEVEIGPGPEYFITVNPRYLNDLHGTAAVLAHEVTHVFLHRRGIRFAAPGKNEILTDVAAVYLGIGWLMLHAYRGMQAVGYVSPQELGYTLAKRALAFGENIDAHFGDNQAARRAYRTGHERALLDYAHAPLTSCDAAARARYEQDKRYALSGQSFAGGYRFEGREPMKVVFRCPVCHRQARVPVGRTVTVRCGVCGSTLGCRT